MCFRSGSDKTHLSELLIPLIDSIFVLMDEEREKRVRGDWISNLPDSLLCQVLLLNLPTKDVVKTSVLSHRWRNLWKCVPGLELDNRDFAQHNRFVSFVDYFLGLNTESCLHRFKLKYDCDDEPEFGLINRCIHSVATRKVKHIDVLDDSYGSWDLPMPLTLYTCATLVSLKLTRLTLPSPKFVSLPCLKVMKLVVVNFAHVMALETLISQCPVLESLVIGRSFCDDIQVLRVRSMSLLKFVHLANTSEGLYEDLVLVIDAPRLEYLRLCDHRIANFVLNNPASLVEADIDIVFNLIFEAKFDPNDLPKRNMIRKFLRGISDVKDMTITSTTLEVTYDYSRCERLPFFRNLSFLRVELCGYRWEMLPIFLERCPNLKSLVVGSINHREKEGFNILSKPRCFLSSLEYVKIERPLKGEAREMKLVSYFLENSKILKKLTLRFDDSLKKEESVILREHIAIPRLSSSCQVIVL
ncbi:hypothetical protein AALP_AA2G047200 [Arabis alpina]|uniref:FBD domain-containing protein n=1 Tax=Arabis alpina TaxID=50452 RepID=A0A087HFD0_ARAAL|nr:hypothetical protein AALP_AA2G047200 [Arabis alpina]